MAEIVILSGLLMALSGLMVKGFIKMVIFRGVHGNSLKKYIDNQVLKEQFKLNKSKEVDAKAKS